jgi:murein DD-endopeptidase MepM/ murein hydrolase activator NlpD
MSFTSYKNIPLLVKAWIICLLLVLLSFSPVFDSHKEAYGVSRRQKIEEFKYRQYKIELKRKQTRRKIEQIKKEENKALRQLRNTQYKLEMARVSLVDQQYRLNEAKGQLDQLKGHLIKLDQDQQKLKTETSKRIRQIYKGERLSLLHMVFGAKNINQFLDRMYYQQRMVKRDKEVLEKLKAKTIQLVNTKNQLETQQESILTTINTIENRKKEISIAININRELVNRLKHDRVSYEAAENQLARESSQIGSTIRSILSKSNQTVSYATGGFIRPISGRITSNYGWRRHPIFGSSKFHTGVDISAPYGTAIRVANSGKVIYTGWYGGYGKVVIVDHGKGVTTLYAHLSSYSVGNGQAVSKGQVIAREGSTGYSTGPHLHFEVRINGRHVNPFGYI